MKTQQQQEALQNFATRFGFIVNVYTSDDKRKNDKFFITDKKNVSISPLLDYDGCNHFLLGYLLAVEKLIGKNYF